MERYKAAALGEIVDRGLDLLYPRNCIGCGRAAEGSGLPHVCGRCAAGLYRVEPPFCATCGFPFYGLVEGKRECPFCRELNPAFLQGRTLILHRGIGRVIVEELKYRGATFLGKDIAALAATATALGGYLRGSVLVPVPLHRRKLRERGYNQSERIASAIVSVWASLPIADLLVRTVDTESQTRLNRRRRMENVRKAFGLKDGAAISRSECYMIIDDVYTSGATLNACAHTLRKGGAASVKVLTLAHG